MAKPLQKFGQPTELEKLTGQVSAAKAEVDEAREEVARLEKAMEVMRADLAKIPDDHPDHKKLDAQLLDLEDDKLPEAREVLEAKEKAASEALDALAAASKAASGPAAPPAPPTQPAATAGAAAPLKVPKAGAKVRVRWVLNGVGQITSAAVVKTVHDAEKGLLDLTVQHGERLINLDAVPPGWRSDLSFCWML